MYFFPHQTLNNLKVIYSFILKLSFTKQILKLLSTYKQLSIYKQFYENHLEVEVKHSQMGPIKRADELSEVGEVDKLETSMSVRNSLGETSGGKGSMQTNFSLATGIGGKC